MNRSLIFSFGPFGRALALAVGASASTPDPLGAGPRGADVEAVTILAVGKRSKRTQWLAARLCAAPFPGPAAWRGMFRCRACPEASAEGPLFPAMRPADIGGRTRGIVETVSLRSTHPIISQFGINPFFTDVHVQKFPEGPSFSHVLESPMGFVFRDGFCRARSRLFSETGSGEEPWRSLASNWRPAVGSSD